MRSTIVGSVLLIALILAASVWAVLLFQGIGLMSPEEALPPDTQVVIRAPDVPRLVRKIARARPGADPVESRWNLIADLLERLLTSQGARMSPSSADIERLMTGEAIVALIPDGEPAGALAVILDVGHGSEETIDRARRFLEVIPASAGGLWSVRRHRGLEYASWRPAGGGLLCVTGLHGLSILTTSVEAMRKILDTLAGGPDPLLSDPDYRNIRSRIDDGSPLLIFAAGTRLRGTLDSLLTAPRGGSRRNIAYLLGLDAMKAGGLSVDIVKGRFVERLFIAMDTEDRGLLGEIFAASPRRARLSRLAPADMPYTISLSLTSLDAVTRRLPAIVGGASRRERRAFRDRLSGLEDFLALDLERDVFGTLGEHLTLSFEPPAPGSAPEEDRSLGEMLLASRGIAAISVREREGLRSLLDRIDGLARAMAVFNRSELGGRSMTTYRFPFLRPLEPAYSLHEEFLIAATSPDLLRQSITASSRKESLADRQEARQLLRALPDKVHLLLVADTGRLARFLRLEDGILPAFLPRDLRGEIAGGSDPGRAALACRLGRSGFLVESVAPVSPFLLAYARLEQRRGGRDPDEAVRQAEPAH